MMVSRSALTSSGACAERRIASGCLSIRAARAEPNDRARASVFVGVLAVLLIPAGLALAAYSSMVDLIHVAVAVPRRCSSPSASRPNSSADARREK